MLVKVGKAKFVYNDLNYNDVPEIAGQPPMASPNVSSKLEIKDVKKRITTRLNLEHKQFP